MSETPPSPRNRPSNGTTSIQKAIAEIEKELVGDIALGTRLSDDATLSAWQIRQVLWKHYDEANETYLEGDIAQDRVCGPCSRGQHAPCDASNEFWGDCTCSCNAADRFGSVPLPRPRPANYIERQEP